MASSLEHGNILKTRDNESSETDESNECNRSKDCTSLPTNDFTILKEPVQKRINALKNLQLEIIKLEAKFYEEVHLLECKYNRFYCPILEKRQFIITGLYEPTHEECKWKLDSKLTEDNYKEEEKSEVVENSEELGSPSSSNNDQITGIPYFWLTVLKRVDIIKELIQPWDEPVLANLIDIQVILLEPIETDPTMGFVLEFHFAPNDYFSHSVLTKEYQMKCAPDPNDPFNFEGCEIVKCTGYKIDWKKGKNVTVKQVKKKLRKTKNRLNVSRYLVKTTEKDSFFHFFDPPELPEDTESDNYEEILVSLIQDFEMALYIRQQVVPKAVLFFTGEITGSDSDFDDLDDSTTCSSNESSCIGVIEENQNKSISEKKKKNRNLISYRSCEAAAVQNNSVSSDAHSAN